MKKNDRGMGELLELLRTHPELITTLVFDARKLRRLLRTQEARRLLLGVDVGTLLRSVTGSELGAPLLACLQLTALMVPPMPCPGNTKTLPTCPGNTRALPTCPGNTRTLAPAVVKRARPRVKKKR
jgi:hypothetical protein